MAHVVFIKTVYTCQNGMWYMYLLSITENCEHIYQKLQDMGKIYLHVEV